MDPADVVIDPAKIRDYLLSSSHPIGRFKALFFFRLGYTLEEWDVLERDLRSVCARGVRRSTIAGPYGVKHVIGGRLVGPSGLTADVTTVWIAREGESSLRFVTAYPGAAE